MEIDAIRVLIRLKLRDGRLPLNGFLQVRVAAGKGEPCDACEITISKLQLGIQGISLAAGGGRPLQLHGGCFQIWNAERRVLPSRSA